MISILQIEIVMNEEQREAIRIALAEFLATTKDIRISADIAWPYLHQRLETK